MGCSWLMFFAVLFAEAENMEWINDAFPLMEPGQASEQGGLEPYEADGLLDWLNNVLEPSPSGEGELL